MIVKEFDYVKGNTALAPKRKSTEKDRRKYEELKRAKKNRQRRIIDQRKSNIIAMIQISSLILLFGIITIARDSNVFELQNQLTNVNQQIKNVTDDNEALNIDLLKDSSLENVMTTANQSLGMTMATKDNLVPVDLSVNYFSSLDKKNTSENKTDNKGIINRMIDALGL